MQMLGTKISLHVLFVNHLLALLRAKPVTLRISKLWKEQLEFIVTYISMEMTLVYNTFQTLRISILFGHLLLH